MLDAGIPQSRVALRERRRGRTIQHPRRHALLAQRRRLRVGGDAQRPAHIGFGNACGPREALRISRLSRQTVDHLEQQRQRGRRTVLARQRRSIGAADPHADRVAAGATDRPRIAIAVAGAGLPGDARATAGVEGALAFAGTRIGGKDLAHDPRRTGRQQPAFDARIGRGIAHAPRDAIAMQRRERTDKIFQPRTGTAEDHRQVGRCPAREFQGDPCMLQPCGEARRL